MSINFENNNDILVYALAQVIAYPGRTEQIVVARCTWWLASVWGLEEGLIVNIANLAGRNLETLRQDQTDP